MVEVLKGLEEKEEGKWKQSNRKCLILSALLRTFGTAFLQGQGDAKQVLKSLNKYIKCCKSEVKKKGVHFKLKRKYIDQKITKVFDAQL